MQQITKNKYFIPCILFFISLLFRLVFISNVPTSISGDELLYVMTAKSISLTGSDMTGTWNPLSSIFFWHPPNELQAELPYFLQLPFVKVLPLSLLSARLPSVIFGSFIPVVLYLITKKIVNHKAGVIAGFMATVNPWLIVNARTAYEHTPAMFFYLSGIMVFLYTNNWKMLIGLLLFIFGFYTYIGTKMIFLPLLFSTLIYSYFVTHKKPANKMPYITVAVASVVFLGVFLFQMKQGAFGDRTSSLFLPTSQELSLEVQENRKSSIRTIFTYVFENKMILYVDRLVQKTFYIFSPFYLFASGDQFYSLYRHGVMYEIDALFIILGLMAIGSISIGSIVYIFTLICISILPELFFTASVNVFTPHFTFLFLILIIIMAIGIDKISCLIRTRKLKRIAFIFITALYSVFVMRFVQFYFLEYPIIGQSDFPKRIVSRYLALETSRPVYVYVDAPYDMMRKYLFYANVYSGENAYNIKNIVQSGKYQIGNVTFQSCDNTIDPTLIDGVILYARVCGNLKKETDFKSIKSLKDGGEVFHIYNDTLCKKFRLTRFPEKLTLRDFSIENLDTPAFCRAFISF